MAALLLSLETSTNICSAALLKEHNLLAEVTLHKPRVHAERLTVMIDQIMKGADLSFNQLSGIVVSSGPGSYTGLRIGTSTAKGLAFAHDLPLIGVSSLKAIAAEATVCADPGDWICATRSARKNEVFLAFFEVHESSTSLNELSAVYAPKVATVDELPKAVDIPSEKRLWITGDARTSVAEVLERPSRCFTAKRPSPTAFWGGLIGVDRYHNQQFEDLASFEPNYLRPFHTHKRKPIFDRLPNES